MREDGLGSMCRIDQMENGKDLKREKDWYSNEFKHCHKNNTNKIFKKERESLMKYLNSALKTEMIRNFAIADEAQL